MEAIDGLCSGSSLVHSRHSRFGRLVVVNNGPEGNGFLICHTCGYGEPAPSSNVNGSGSTEHKSPRTREECSGTLYPYHLGHSFLTDVTEYEPEGPGLNVTRSLLYALLEGASQALSIQRDDISGTLYWTGGSMQPSLIIFDSVPGGAGHARRIDERSPEVFRKALDIVSRGCCGPKTSCYECLRTYRNQRFHDQLSRGEAKETLKKILS